MKLTILGMWGGFPQAGGATSGYLLQSETTSVLLDCGSGVLSRLLQIHPLNALDAVVLSHYHADHCSDIGVLQYARLVYQAKDERFEVLPIYGYKNETDFLRLTYKEGRITNGISYQENQSFQIGDLTFLPFRTEHVVECYGFRITGPTHTLCYTADGGFSEQQIQAAAEVDLLLAEANFSHADQDLARGNHMTGTQVGLLATEAKAKRVLLTHLPPLGLIQPIYEEVKKEYAGLVELATEGHVIKL